MLVKDEASANVSHNGRPSRYLPGLSAKLLLLTILFIMLAGVLVLSCLGLLWLDAVLRGGLGLVNALLAHGADPNLRMTKGTPVRRNSEDFELPATLIGATPYFLAAKYVEADIMRALAAGGADTRLSMKSGETPLMAAAGMGASPQTDRRGLSILDGGALTSPSQSSVLSVTNLTMDTNSSFRIAATSYALNIYEAAIIGAGALLSVDASGQGTSGQ